jgi:2-polyprenyl-6-methoxyphenol hydroxylase-like FAD-dependent oxidoreductase
MARIDKGNGSHAIVIGGSMVGSVIAAVLADHFKRVTILERDWVPKGPGSRAGVPQSRHVHVLLARGAAELDLLFPGFLKEMADRGAQIVDVGRDVAWLTPAGWGVPFNSGLSLCCATRDLIEWQTRNRALARGNVTLVDATAVTGLVTDDLGLRVTGVRVRDRRYDVNTPTGELQADLVVDATGRGSQLSDWLEALGRERVREEVIDAGMTYASRFYALRPNALRGWRAAYVQAALPGHLRGGIMFPVEDNRWHLTIFGYGTAAPPMNETGFREFVEGLRSSVLADVLQNATPLTPIVGHRRTENRWRRFDEMANWPDGLIAAGDSVCCFDPVYGQGITTGVLGALAIRARLVEEWNGSGSVPGGFARRVQQRMVEIVRPAWNLATGEDLRLASTTGGRLRRRDRLMQHYFDRVVAASTADAKIRGKLLAVMNMIEGPESLMNPQVIAGLLRHMCGRNDKPEPLWLERSLTQRGGKSDVPRRPANSHADSRVA